MHSVTRLNDGPDDGLIPISGRRRVARNISMDRGRMCGNYWRKSETYTAR